MIRLGATVSPRTPRRVSLTVAALGQASWRASRKLLAIEDLGDPPRRVRRVLLYRVEDSKLRECWLRDEDQRFIDALWSTEPDQA